MALHHKMKSHHHLSVWAVSVFLFLSMFATYLETQDSSANQNGPSEKTKKFFGAEGGGGGKKYQNPPECERVQQEEQSKIQNIVIQMQQIQTQMQQKQAMANEKQGLILQKQTEMQNATSEQQSAIQVEIQDIQTQMQQISTEVNQLQAQSQELQNQMNAMQANRTQTWEPPAACKQAIVNMMKAEMATMKSMINSNIMPTFTKVDATVVKIEAKIPALKESGQDPVLIQKIEANIASIKANEATLQDFFKYMIGKIDSFLNLANSDVNSAFGGMQKGDSTRDTKASNAADGLVNAFEELEKLVNQLK